MAYSATTNLGLKKTNSTGIEYEDDLNLLSNNQDNLAVLETALAGTATASATNATIVNTGAARFIPLYRCSAGSIATITGMLTNVPFTLIMQSSGASFGLANVSPFKLSADWIPNVTKSNVTLIWDGTNYLELARVTTA